MTMPDPNSFYALLMQNEARMSQSGSLLHATLDALTQEKGLRKERYEKIDDYAHLTDDNVVDIIFDDRNAMQRRACIGDVSRDDFRRRFANGLRLYEDAAEKLVEIFGYASFPETYLHPQIAQVLHGTGKLMNPKSAAERIGDTALIMVRAMGENSLATIALIAASHLRRHLTGNPNYNADTVEFTLLTFSYFGAKRSGVQDADWFFYWKVFGSFMGLAPNRLHDNFEAAKGRMSELHKQCPSPPTRQSKELLDVFVEAFDVADEIRRINQKGLVSKRLHAYLVAEKVWPADLMRTKGPGEW